LVLIRGIAIFSRRGQDLSGTRGNRFDVTADGARFLIVDDVGGEAERPEIMLVLNWAAELKQ
jgi:hypothetical protein